MHSIVLFFRIVSFVTPEAGTNAASRDFLAAFLRVTPSDIYASVNAKSFITQTKDWQTISFKSLDTVVVISRTEALPPKLLELS